MISSWHSYPKVWNFGHSNVFKILEDEVHVEEKLDGSQFSFGIFNGELKCKSKSVELVLDAPEKMFSKAVEVVKQLAPFLKDGWTYRAEYFQKPKHNVLSYDRIPNNHLIIFDINTHQEEYLSYEAKKIECERLGLECVPLLYKGRIDSPELLLQLLDTVSILGGQKIEGIVVKNYKKFGADGKALLAKHVSESFKEIHKKDWKESNPGNKDIVDLLGDVYRTPARWNKAVQHLREKGLLTNSPKDIGLLMKEAQSDLREECKQEIMDQLFDWAYPKIQRKVTNGLAEWYKEQLLQSQFEVKDEDHSIK